MARSITVSRKGYPILYGDPVTAESNSVLFSKVSIPRSIVLAITLAAFQNRRTSSLEIVLLLFVGQYAKMYLALTQVRATVAAETVVVSVDRARLLEFQIGI